MNVRSEVDAASLDAQCWMSSVTGFMELQGAEIQNTGLRRSESSGSWNGPERLALMFMLHSFMPPGRLSSKTDRFNPYPFHLKKLPLEETTKSVSAITSTPQMESRASIKMWYNVKNYWFNDKESTYHWSSLRQFHHMYGELAPDISGNLWGFRLLQMLSPLKCDKVVVTGHLHYKKI